MHFGLVVVMVGLLLASGTAASFDRTQRRVEALPEAERAYVIGVHGAQCIPRKGKCGLPYNKITIFIEELDGGSAEIELAVQEGGLFLRDTAYDVVDLERTFKGMYFCEALPPGRYALAAHRYANYSGGGSSITLRRKPEALQPFDLGPGELLDVGEMAVMVETVKGPLGLTGYGADIVRTSASTDAQTRAALAKCPENVRMRPLRSLPSGLGNTTSNTDSEQTED